MADRPPVFSRSGNSSLFGKRTVPLHTKVSDETSEGLRLLMRDAGIDSISEFIALLLETRVHGDDMVRSMANHRIAVVSGKAQKRQ